MYRIAALFLPFLAAAAAPTSGGRVLGGGCDPWAQDPITDAWFSDSDVVAKTNPHWSFAGSAGVTWDFDVVGHNYDDEGWPDPLRSWRLHFNNNGTSAGGFFTATASQLVCTHQLFRQSMYAFVGGLYNNVPHGAQITMKLNDRVSQWGPGDDPSDHLDFCTSTGKPHAYASCGYDTRFHFKTPEGLPVYLNGIDGGLQTPDPSPNDQSSHSGEWRRFEMTIQYRPDNLAQIPDVVVTAPWIAGA